MSEVEYRMGTLTDLATVVSFKIRILECVQNFARELFIRSMES